MNKDKKQFSMAETKVTWDVPNTDHTQTPWTECYDDKCLTHKASKDLGYYPRETRKRKARQVSQRSKTPMPADRALQCADGPTAEVVTMDQGKLIVTGTTDLFIHAKTHYYRVQQYYGGCRTCRDTSPHQHIWYDPNQPWKEMPAFTKLAFCVHPYCVHWDPAEKHVHERDNRHLRTIWVDEEETTQEETEVSVQMSDVNFPTCELSDSGYEISECSWESKEWSDSGRQPHQYEEVMEGSIEIEDPLPYPHKKVIIDITDEDVAHTQFLCPRKDCDWVYENHVHELHYDPRDMTRPFPPLNRRTMLQQLCEYRHCPYDTSIGPHLHWTKNE